jgi:hypothetical protein
MEGARELDKVLVERVLLANPLQQTLETVFLTEQGYMASEDMVPGVASG